jgi:hypothetical protein
MALQDLFTPIIRTGDGIVNSAIGTAATSRTPRRAESTLNQGKSELTPRQTTSLTARLPRPSSAA